MHIVTFSNLFPSSVMPTHGLFVYERMRRVAEAMDCKWSVIAPVPAVSWPLRWGRYKLWGRVPVREQWQSADVHHPRFVHWPGLSQKKQADAVAACSRDLVAELAGDGPVVLDAHYLWPDGVAVARLAAELDLPFTLTARGSDVHVLGQDPYIAKRIAEAARCAQSCMAVSDALGSRFADIASLPPERVVTVRNGVDLARFAPGDQAEARRQLGLPVTGRIALGVGQLIATKGFDVAARAVQALGDTTLVLVGAGADRAKIEAIGGGRTIFLGPLLPDQVAVAFRAADVFVLPSEREGWPNVVTEALASGLPVVSTRVGGIPQIMGGEEPPVHLGALVKPGDVDALGAALQRVLACGKRSDEVRAFAERYCWQQPVTHLANMFRQIAGETHL